MRVFVISGLFVVFIVLVFGLYNLSIVNSTDVDILSNQSNETANINNEYKVDLFDSQNSYEIPITDSQLICNDITYLELEPKTIQEAYQEEVCETIEYEEAYQDTKCHNEKLEYIIFDSSSKSTWTIQDGCVILTSSNVKNQDPEKSGIFIIQFQYI